MFFLCGNTLGSLEVLNCSKRDSPRISLASWYYEAVLGTEQVLTCRICKYQQQHVEVVWQKNGAPVRQSGRVHYSSHSPEEFSLRVRAVSTEDLGNYTCSLKVSGRQVESATLLLDTLPPPPVFVRLRDGLNETEQLLSWTGESRMPIIHFLLEFRLQPLSGTGEDWVSLVIPYNTRATIQQYLLRGLTSATSYEARIRTKTRHGVSHYSTTWQFTTWSPWTTSRPATVFLPRTGHESFTDSDQYKNNFAKELSSFSGVEFHCVSSSILMFLVMLLLQNLS